MLLISQWKWILISRLLEIKSDSPKTTQKQIAQNWSYSDSTIKRYSEQKACLVLITVEKAKQKDEQQKRVFYNFTQCEKWEKLVLWTSEIVIVRKQFLLADKAFKNTDFKGTIGKNSKTQKEVELVVSKHSIESYSTKSQMRQNTLIQRRIFGEKKIGETIEEKDKEIELTGHEIMSLAHKKVYSIEKKEYKTNGNLSKSK